ncbi:splicing factor 45, partial [Tremellales sp. Uapishka_1]
MSLFGGITFNSEQAKALATSSTIRLYCLQHLSYLLAARPSAIATEAPRDADTPAKTIGERPAALEFAPRLKKPKPASARPASLQSSSIASSSTISATPHMDIVRAASPKLHKVDEVILDSDGRPLAKAPAMTLAAAGQREWSDRAQGAKRGKAEGDRKKKKKPKKKKKAFIPQLIVSTFDPEELYDPNRPNDLGEYQQYRKRLREEKHSEVLEAKRRRAAGEYSSDEGSSYYTDSEEEVAPRRDAPKLFAPPRAYSPPSSFSGSRSSFVPPPPSLTAPSGPVASGDDAYARRLAMSQAASGDDAYARRLALSQGRAPPPPAVVPTPPQTFAPPPFETYAPPPPSSAVPPPPPSAVDISGIPGFGAYRPPPQVEVSSAPSGQDKYASEVEEKRRAAAAIAAKFGGPPPPPPPAEIIEGETFSQKMFRQWGHKEGTGLGVDGKGIVHALSTEHVAPAAKLADPNVPLSKRALAKQKAAAANAKNRKWVQAPSARGRIVNLNENEKVKEDKERFGENSRIVCLVGMVGSPDEVDEELSDEIGTECSNYGIVERVVLHLVEPPPPEPQDCLRIFIVFSGLAGAWKAAKSLDGRYFGGRKIRAMYFDEKRFDDGDRDGNVL